MTWMTVERTSAPAAGAPTPGCTGVAGRTIADPQIQKRARFAPSAYGPGLVGGTTVISHTNDHAALGRTAWDGTPLDSPDAGYG